MGDTRTLLQEVKGQRIARDRVDEYCAELKKAWHAPFWILASQLPWMSVFLFGFDRKHVVPIVLSISASTFTIIGVVLNMRQRDRMWRELIETQNPELARRINDAMDVS